MMTEDDMLPEHSRRALMDTFAAFDKSGDKTLSKHELPEALRFAGMIASDQQIDEILEHFDINQDGKLQISELVDSYKVLVEHSIRGDELLEAFKKFDANGDGVIRIPELKAVLMKAGEKWSHQEVQSLLTTEFILKYDKNGDGKFDYSEFVAMFRDGVFDKPHPVRDTVKTPITEEYELIKK